MNNRQYPLYDKLSQIHNLVELVTLQEENSPASVAFSYFDKNGNKNSVTRRKFAINPCPSEYGC